MSRENRSIGFQPVFYASQAGSLGHVVMLSIVLSFASRSSFAIEQDRPRLSAAEVAALIDERLRAPAGDPAQEFVNDATLLRRLTLDTVGRIPTISEVRDFLEDTSQTKYSRAVDRLVGSGAHVQTMATLWRRVWIPQADTIEFAAVTDDFERWLIQELQWDKRYDQLVREVVVGNMNTTTGAISPHGFYDANESKPENIAASATRAFLGINLGCAQCHDHPFSRWTREQFWQTAAFFSEPNQELEFTPKLLSVADMPLPDNPDSVTRKTMLADWMLKEDKRFLARNAVNRLWSHYFGGALVEPMDDLSADAAQSGPRAELLKELADVFINCGYDVELLTRAIVNSDAYRLSSRVRGLSAEQLYHSLRTSAGLPPAEITTGNEPPSDSRQSFVLTFHVERIADAERSISQALALMNGSLTNSLAKTDNNKTLAAIVASPFMTFDEQIDAVFVAVLGRHSIDEERTAVLGYAQSQVDEDHQRCLEDLYWTLINSPEFSTNH